MAQLFTEYSLPTEVQTSLASLNEEAQMRIIQKRAEELQIADIPTYLTNLQNDRTLSQGLLLEIEDMTRPLLWKRDFADKIIAILPWIIQQQQTKAVVEICVPQHGGMAELLPWLIILQTFSRKNDLPVTFLVSTKQEHVTRLKAKSEILMTQQALAPLEPALRQTYFELVSEGLYRLSPDLPDMLTPLDITRIPALVDTRQAAQSRRLWDSSPAFFICDHTHHLHPGENWLDREMGLSHQQLPVPEAGISQEEEYFEMIRKMPFPMMLHQDNKIVFANQSALEVMEASSLEAIRGLPIRKFVDDSSWPMILERLKSIYGPKGMAPLQRGKFLRVDRTPFFAEVSGVRVQYRGAAATLIAFRDVTAAAELHQQYKELTEKLEARVTERTMALAESNQDLESFAYSVSHDLRAPLRHLISFAGLLRHQLKNLSSNQESFLEHIEGGALKMNRMIEGLLEYSRIGRSQLNPEFLDTVGVVQDVLQDLQPDIHYRTTAIHTQSLPPAWADPIQFEIIWSNLLSNALKYSHLHPAPQISIKGWETENETFFQVVDNGIGFPDTRKEEMFQVFRRLETGSAYPGLGIGLSNVKRIIQRHGGTLDASRLAGEKTAFTFGLPKQGLAVKTP